MKRPTSLPAGLLLPMAGRWRSYLLASVALAVCLCVLGLYWLSMRERELREREREFMADTRAAALLIQQNLFHYELMLRGGVALFGSVQRPSAEQWTHYVDGLQFESQFPSLSGLGYATYASSTERLRQLEQSVRQGSLPHWRVVPAGQREAYGPILFLDPSTPANRIAIGYDMFSEPVRRTAMVAARDTGTPQLSGVVTLVQDAGAEGRVGMLMYSPVYVGDVVPPSQALRRERLRGWVYAPFHADRFLRASLRALPTSLSMRVLDIDRDKETLIYVDPTFSGESTDIIDAAAFQHTIPLHVYGRQWRLEFESTSHRVMLEGMRELNTTVLVGFLASWLLFFVILGLARTRAQAQAIAERMTESYRRSEQRFRSAMRYSAIGKALLDHEGRIVDSNPALSSISGRAPEELREMAIGDLAATGERSSLDEAGQRTHWNEEVHRITCNIVHAEGLVRTVQMTFAPVPGEKGSDVASLVQVEDVTERVRTENRIRALNSSLEARVALRTRELQQANKELESFSYTISHDLRAPLRAIDGFSRIIESRHANQLDDTGQGYLARIRAAAQRMSELIDALLAISRLGRGELQRERVDMSALAADIVAELREQNPEREVQVHIEPGMTVLADPTLLRNLLQNLFDNAWKFTGRTADAAIRLERADDTDGESGFALSDNGAGFDQAYVNKLFRPFQRLHGDGEFEGTGVGLASVRRIVERHGGSIRAESQPGQGARFVFTLPDPRPGEDEEGPQASLL